MSEDTPKLTIKAPDAGWNARQKFLAEFTAGIKKNGIVNEVPCSPELTEEMVKLGLVSKDSVERDEALCSEKRLFSYRARILAFFRRRIEDLKKLYERE